MGHRKRPVEFVKIGLASDRKTRGADSREIVRAIRFHFEPDGIAAARTPQLLLDAAQKVLGFFLVDVEIAVAGDAKGVHAVEERPGKRSAT